MCYILSIFQIQQSLYAIKRVNFFYFIYLRERIVGEYSQLSSLTVANKRKLYLWARERDTPQYLIFNGALKEERKIQTHLVFTTKDLRLKSNE